MTDRIKSAAELDALPHLTVIEDATKHAYCKFDDWVCCDGDSWDTELLWVECTQPLTVVSRPGAPGFDAKVEQALASAAESTRLVEYALNLRMYGERAPGGTETWRQFDRDAESHLRSENTKMKKEN